MASGQPDAQGLCDCCGEPWLVGWPDAAGCPRCDWVLTDAAGRAPEAPPRADLVEPAPGGTYLVPHVPLAADLDGEWAPVAGPAHYDPDVDPRVPEHWHVDWRFASDALWTYATTHDGYRTERGPVFMTALGAPPPAGRCYRVVVQAAGRPVRWKAATYARVPPEYDHQDSPFFAAFEEAAEARGLRLAPGCRACPHQGVPLAAGPPPRAGVATCPGHGLKWDLATGALVRARTR